MKHHFHTPLIKSPHSRFHPEFRISLYMEKQIFHTGDEPGKGRYHCSCYSHVVLIDDNNEPLPECGSCLCLTWERPVPEYPCS